MSDDGVRFVITYAYFLTTKHMAIQTGPVVEERHIVHHDDDASSAGMIAVLLVAAVVIIGFLLFAMRAFPFGAAGTAGTSNLDVNLPDINVPATDAPDVNVNQENNVPATNE